jgi:GNAT superfamily N-acetyltransferase
MDIREVTAEATRPIRREVLKPGLPESEVHLPGDDNPSTIHLGFFEENRLVGIATFLPEACPVQGGMWDWRLRGMATLESVRNAGIGGMLLEAGIARARELRGARVWCNGRASARRFYERHGFAAVGDEFALPFTGPHYLFVLELEVDATLR